MRGPSTGVAVDVLHERDRRPVGSSDPTDRPESTSGRISVDPRIGPLGTPVTGVEAVGPPHAVDRANARVFRAVAIYARPPGRQATANVDVDEGPVVAGPGVRGPEEVVIPGDERRREWDAEDPPAGPGPHALVRIDADEEGLGRCAHARARLAVRYREPHDRAIEGRAIERHEILADHRERRATGHGDAGANGGSKPGLALTFWAVVGTLDDARRGRGPGRRRHRWWKRDLTARGEHDRSEDDGRRCDRERGAHDPKLSGRPTRSRSGISKAHTGRNSGMFALEGRNCISRYAFPMNEGRFHLVQIHIALPA